MPRIFALFCLLMACAGLGAAQVPTSGNVFFGYSYLNSDLSPFSRTNMNGWQASLEGRVFPHIGIVVAFNQVFGSQNVATLCPAPACSGRVSFTQDNVLFGPRVSASVGKFRPFAELLIGIGHVNLHHARSDTSFATAIGGGLDYRLIRPLAWRFEGD